MEKYDLKIEKNTAYGHISGYEVNVVVDPMKNGPLFIFSTYLSQAQKNQFITKMNAFKISLVQSTSFDFGVAVLIGAFTAKGFAKKFDDTLTKILSTLESLNAPKCDYCPQSGVEITEENSKLITLPDSNVKIKLSLDAVSTYNSQISKANEDFENAPNNYLKGFFGILLGAIAGVILTFVFAYFHYVAAISSIVSIALGTFLYSKFGGKKDWVMITMSFFTTAILILSSIFVAYFIAAINACKEAGFDYTGLEAFKYVYANVGEFKRSLFIDLGLNGLFILIGEGLMISSLIHSIKRPKNID